MDLEKELAAVSEEDYITYMPSDIIQPNEHVFGEVSDRIKRVNVLIKKILTKFEMGGSRLSVAEKIEMGVKLQELSQLNSCLLIDSFGTSDIIVCDGWIAKRSTFSLTVADLTLHIG